MATTGTTPLDFSTTATLCYAGRRINFGNQQILERAPKGPPTNPGKVPAKFADPHPPKPTPKVGPKRPPQKLRKHMFY